MPVTCNNTTNHLHLHRLLIKNTMPDIVLGEYAFDSSKVIGKGRHATIYEGYHAGKGTKVAVKKVDWSFIPKSKHENLKKKLQQSLGVQKKTYENVLTLLDFQVCINTAFIFI